MTRSQGHPDLNTCARQGCGHSADMHAPGGACTNRPDLLSEPCVCESFLPTHHVTTRVLMDAQYRTWEQYLGHQDPPVGDEGRPYWRPSMLGYCARRNLMWRRGVKDTRIEAAEDEADKLRRFAWGNMIEKKVIESIELSGLLISQQVGLVDEDLEVSGSADVLWGGLVKPDLPERRRYWEADYDYAVRALRGEVLDLAQHMPVPVTMTEIKSTHSHAVRSMYKDGPRIDHEVQCGTYYLISKRHPEQLPSQGIDRFELVIVGRDAVRPLVFGIHERHAQLAADRIGELNDFFHRGSLPDCTCGTTKGLQWEQKYCGYQDPSDPSTCCNTTLLDRLESSLRVVPG